MTMEMKEFVRRIFGSEQSGYRAAHERRNAGHVADDTHVRPLEGAGRSDWDIEQNRGYSNVYGNASGPSTFVERGTIRHFRGKGPKDYRRSDERIREDICDSLTDDRFLDASNVEIEVRNGEVILSGSVGDRRAKRRAEDLAESIRGVKHLENRLKVFAHQGG